jgi:uncharacterized protein YndB with AHSA1/START domain
MRVVLVVFGVLVALILIVLLIGSALPVKHRAAREATIPVAPDSVFAAITDFHQFPAWRPSVKSTERVTAAADTTQYREIGRDGAILYAIDELIPGQRLVTRIADPSLPFGGRWVFELSPSVGGTTLRITEEGEVYNPIFRFVSRYVMSHHRTIDTYLGDLGRRFGAAPVISNAQ